MITASQKSQAFGEKRIVCVDCGMPLEVDAFAEGAVLCANCTSRELKRRETLITPEDYVKSHYEAKLQELHATAEPNLVPGIQAAQEKLGCSPSEVIADQINALLAPEKALGGAGSLTADQLAALPIDRKLVIQASKMLQDAQIVADSQLKDAGNPYSNIHPDELRGVMLQGATDHAANDRDLRLQLIRTMADRVDTFFDEVMEVAQEIQADAPSVEVIVP